MLAARVSALLLLLTGSVTAEVRRPLSGAEDYRKYIGALVAVADFGIHYYDDGAADESVLFPHTDSNPYERPRSEVIAMLRLQSRGIPILIDCLSDGRQTSVQFDGNTVSRPIKVPVGYVCLDILMAVARGAPISDTDCSADGLGACMREGFYFRPDDYARCWKSSCELRPWVLVVQRKWRQAFLNKRLRFRNPYEGIDIPEYHGLTTPSKPLSPAK